MMAQSRAESTRDTCNYGQYINQFPQNTIKVIRKFERIQKKICRHKMSIMLHEICINEEMLPKYTYIYIYIYSAIRKNSNLVKVILNLFCRRILLYSPFHQMTFYILDLRLQNSKWGITVHMCTRKKKDLYDSFHIFDTRIIYTHCLKMLTGYH